MSEIILYGAPWCAGCRRAKNYLQQKKVEFTYKDVDDEKNMEELRTYGVQAIPLLVTRNTTVSGFSQENYDEALEDI